MIISSIRSETMHILFNKDPSEVLRDIRETHPSAVMDVFTWKKPENGQILAQVQIRTGDPYFWIYLPANAKTEDQPKPGV
jgi:hypothetical protein